MVVAIAECLEGSLNDVNILEYTKLDFQLAYASCTYDLHIRRVYTTCTFELQMKLYMA